MPTSEDSARYRDARVDLAAWSSHAQEILDRRTQVSQNAASAADAMRREVIEIRPASHSESIFILPLRDGHGALLAALAHHAGLAPLTPALSPWLTSLTQDVPRALARARASGGLRRVFSNSKTKREADDAVAYLAQFHTSAISAGIPQLLANLDDNPHGPATTPLSYALSPEVGLTSAFADLGSAVSLPASAVTSVPASVYTVRSALAQEAAERDRAVEAARALRLADARRTIASTPVERLKDVTQARIRTAPLVDAGLTTVLTVMTHAKQLARLPGIGETTARRIEAAATSLWRAAYEDTQVRFDPQARTSEATTLLHRLNTWSGAREFRQKPADVAAAMAVAPLAAAVETQQPALLLVFTPDGSADPVISAVAAAKRCASTIASLQADDRPLDPWPDFEAHPADYYALLQELGFLAESQTAVEGDLPENVIEAVRAFPLDTSLLTASLRGYQAFAAKFALVQRKVIIGDEMGLGKTLEALAAIAHLSTGGQDQALVVCPAAVVTNWVREIESKTTLTPHRLHGPGRDTARRRWLEAGGVAVTTYESLGWLSSRLSNGIPIDCIVVDEAHYIKNEGAQRSRRCSQLIANASRALLLTGTPLENRVDEFRNLVRYVRPDLLIDGEDMRPRLFRRQVAPAYLRRNQEDVLTELPELVEIDEWLPFSSTDAAAYRDAVLDGNFHSMRKAPLLQGSKSEKIQRLIEIVDEAEENGRRVIVFSQYLPVLDAVASALSGRVFGPLTGGVPPTKRQQLIDDFSSASGGAVLVAQILAGGVGLNIQAASVVVICEPQLKPTTEWQAIARAHRMGQLQTVQVHRLFSEEGADARVVEILAKKTELFNEFAAISETADGAPEAVDVSDAALAREIVAEEQQRLRAGATIVS